MKIYYKKEQFPEVDKYCRVNPGFCLNEPIQYIPGEDNLVVVEQTAEDQDDFSSFYEEMNKFIAYIISEIYDSVSPNYIALLEEMGNEEIPNLLFIRTFKVVGVDWVQNER
ncbi:MAG: hypothetical protein Q4E53_07210 [Eubacteriales bacterium]|nr:hypothetical protein [Eubacteriales bacterium]